MKVVLLILALLIIIGIVLPILHLLAVALVLAGAVIVVMAAWKVLFGAGAARIGQGGGPPSLPR